MYLPKFTKEKERDFLVIPFPPTPQKNKNKLPTYLLSLFEYYLDKLKFVETKWKNTALTMLVSAVYVCRRQKATRNE